MKPSARVRMWLRVALPVVVAGLSALNGHAQGVTEIGGQKVVNLTRAAVSTTRPEFTGVTVLPGRGMEILYVTANFPGKGNVNVIASPELASATNMLDKDDDDFGDLGYRLGAAFLGLLSGLYFRRQRTMIEQLRQAILRRKKEDDPE